MAVQVCPVVGTTNTVLPPSHPNFDIAKPGQVCPVTKATTDHHHNLSKHPPVEMKSSDDAESCPALTKIVSQPDQKAMDEAVCPVVGTVTSILPPDHPSVDDAKDGDRCPVTNATLGHHKDKVHTHPRMDQVPKGAVCPVTGIKAQ